MDGVVVKTMKTEGLREALRAIHTARAFDMQIMLSCMVESSVGVTVAAHLAPLCEFLDLDGPLLIKNDPYRGLRYAGATLTLPEAVAHHVQVLRLLPAWWRVGLAARVAPPAPPALLTPLLPARLGPGD